MFGFGFLDALKMGGAALAGAAVAGTVAYQAGHWRGDGAGYARAQAENRVASFDQLKERMETDAEIRDMPDADLCALLGGVFRNGTCE